MQNRSRHPALLTLLVLALPATAAAQQSPGVLEGQVLFASTGDAAAGVLVRFGSGQEALTDGEGRFLVEALAPGGHDLVLVTPDCRFSGAEIEVEAGTLHHVELFLPATLEARAPAVEIEEPEKPEGLLVTSAELARMRAQNVTEVVRRVVPSMVGNAGGRVGGYARLQSRSVNSLVDRNPPVVVVDGVRMSNGAEALDALHPSEVERLEILRGAAAGWEFGSSGSAGAILVTTRKGGGYGAAPAAAPVGSRPDPRRCPTPGGGRGSDR